MSRTLVLVRHAKARDTHPRGDHERELAQRGVADALALGRWLAGQAMLPDHVLVSTAARARQTLQALVEGTGATVPAWPEPRIYTGGVDGVLAAVGEVPVDVGTLWVVGHEPVMSALTWQLVEDTGIGVGFPTATAAVLTVPGGWEALDQGGSCLVAMHTGRAEEPAP